MLAEARVGAFGSQGRCWGSPTLASPQVRALQGQGAGYTLTGDSSAAHRNWTHGQDITSGAFVCIRGIKRVNQRQLQICRLHWKEPLCPKILR